SCASWEPGFTKRHNLLIGIFLGILPFFGPWIASVGVVPQLFILTIFVILTGLPHGALDITLLRGGGIGPSGMTIALVIYIGLAVSVVVCFVRFPTVALTLFLIVAWLHFGLGDTENLVGWQRFGECFARGGLSIAGPIAFHGHGTTDLFIQLCGPSSKLNLLEMMQFAKWFVYPCWLAACLLMISLRLRSAFSGSFSTKARNDHFLVAWEIISLILLFWLWPPLAAFGIYFCLIHSVRHLVQLAEARQPHDFRLALRWVWLESWPVVCLTLILSSVLIWYWGGGLKLDTLVLRLVFISLAGLTMPHMLLTYWWHRRAKPTPGCLSSR
ncbi:MAG: Brp/Blh family beta-carotene 15,15'-dioxygenase, partial [Akkermansiaceae bacterium]